MVTSGLSESIAAFRAFASAGSSALWTWWRNAGASTTTSPSAPIRFPMRWRGWLSRRRTAKSCYCARTRAILQQNLPAMRQWVESFGVASLPSREPRAGALLPGAVRVRHAELCVVRAHSGESKRAGGARRASRAGRLPAIVAGRQVSEFLTEGLRRVEAWNCGGRCRNSISRTVSW